MEDSSLLSSAKDELRKSLDLGSVDTEERDIQVSKLVEGKSTGNFVGWTLSEWLITTV